jgi:hypothetical protein
VNELDEETALSVIFANTKRKKRNVDLITVARSFEYLVKFYGSQNAVANRVGLHSEMIRQFRSLLKLPIEVQEMIAKRRIDKLDVAYRISMIKDPSKQVAAAKGIADLSESKDIRDVVRMMAKAGYSTEEAIDRILEAKPKGLHIFVMDFDDILYKEIKVAAKKMSISPAQLVKQIVEEWLDVQKEQAGSK